MIGLRLVALGWIGFVWQISGAELSVTSLVVQQYEDGPPLYRPQAMTPGETVFFSFHVLNASRKNEQVALTFIADAVDPAGVRLALPILGKLETKLSPEDKDWQPKLRGKFELPTTLLPGEYKIAVQLKDGQTGAAAEAAVTYQVDARAVSLSPGLTVENLAFYRSEDAAAPLDTPAYRPGEEISARFDLAGFRHTPEGQIDVTYGIVLADGAGKVLYQENQAARDHSTAFYPKPYVPGSVGLQLKPGTPPGEFSLTVKAVDAIGSQQAEARRTFRVE